MGVMVAIVVVVVVVVVVDVIIVEAYVIMTASFLSSPTPPFCLYSCPSP